MPVLGEMWEERGPFRATPLGERKAERVWGRESWNFPHLAKSREIWGTRVRGKARNVRDSISDALH
jgi:hypothetical protein